MAETNPPRISQLQALGYVGEFLVAILVPTIFCALGGRWLDQRYHTSPFGVLVGLVFALVLVAIVVRRKAEELKRLFYPKSKS